MPRPKSTTKTTNKTRLRQTLLHSVSSQPNEKNPSFDSDVMSSFVDSQWIEPMDNTETGLYNSAIQEDISMEVLADNTIKMYNSHQLDTLRNMINFIIRSTGCLMAITQEAVTEEEGVFSALQELQEELVKLPQQEYPIISKLKENILLRRNLLSFFSSIIDKSQHTLIYDGVLVETLQSWLTTMSSSVYRPFRHTATLIALQITTSLARVGSDLVEELNVVNTQLRTENNKTRKNKDKLGLLRKKVNTITTKKKDVDEFLNDFVDNVFVHRSRDVESIIRKECLQELCTWMQKYSEVFLDNRYLRYFGWAFNDPSANVRSESIQCLIRLYKDSHTITQLTTFIQRFHKRIIEMALYDIDMNTHIHAIRFCKLLYDVNPTLIKDRQDELIVLIGSDNSRLRKSVGPLVVSILQNEYVHDNNVYEAVALLLKEKIKEDTLDNAIDVLFTAVKELQDYDRLADYLCRDHSIEREQEEKILIHVYTYSIKMLLKDNQEISRHLVPVLGQLIVKHADDSNILIQLTSLIPLMDMGVYVELRAENEYSLLTESVIKIFAGANQKQLIQTTSQALRHMNNNTVSSLVLSQLQNAVTGIDIVTGRYSEDTVYALSTALSRLDCLIEWTDMTDMMDQMKITECIGDLLDRAVFGYEQDMSESAMNILSRYTLWKCHRLPSVDAVTVLEKRRMWIFDKYIELVLGQDVLSDVRISAFDHLIDLYWMFSSDIFQTHNLQRLKMTCPHDTQQACSDYVFQHLSSDRLIIAYSKAIMNSIFEINYASPLLQKYGTPIIDQVIKVMITEFEPDLLSGEQSADIIIKMYMDALKSMSEEGKGENTLKLARLIIASMKHADQSDKKISPHVITERIHIDGITFIFSKVAECYENNRDDLMDQSLRFFRVLNLFGKELIRARDIARIHNHLEDCIQQYKIKIEEDKKEWEYYVAYKNTINTVLMKKGLRYDATKRANNAETPHLFEDVMEEDVGNKRRMEIDDRFVTKRTKK